MAIRRGTGNDDSLFGTGRNDTLLGFSGRDRLSTGAGDDRLFGGRGDDALFGQNGHDRLLGGNGADVLVGGRGNDRLLGGNGPDRLAGGSGRDSLNGGNGDDVLFGGSSNDVLNGAAGDDVLNGHAGADQLLGRAGDDTLTGHAGRDFLDGGAGTDRQFGGPGADRIVFDFDDQVIHGNQGMDTLIIRGEDIVLDFDLLDAGMLRGIDVVDLRGSGPNTLKLSAADVLDISDAGQLRIVGGADDYVESPIDVWTRGDGSGSDSVRIGSEDYDIWTHGDATLLIDSDIALNNVTTDSSGASTSFAGVHSTFTSSELSTVPVSGSAGSIFLISGAGHEGGVLDPDPSNLDTGSASLTSPEATFVPSEGSISVAQLGLDDPAPV